MKNIFEEITDITELYSKKIEIDNKIPDEMPKLVPDDFFSSFKNIDPLATTKEFMLREVYYRHGMCGFVSWKWVNPLAEWIGNKKCLEVMAGRGWLSYALRQKNIDVIATDNFSWHYNGNFPLWKETMTPIKRMGAVNAVKRYGKKIDILIMSWAYMDNIAYEVIKTLYKVNPKALVIYIGEGEGGCTANHNFFRCFKEIHNDEFLKAASEYQRWWGLHDELKLGKYKHNKFNKKRRG